MIWENMVPIIDNGSEHAETNCSRVLEVDMFLKVDGDAPYGVRDNAWHNRFLRPPFLEREHVRAVGLKQQTKRAVMPTQFFICSVGSGNSINDHSLIDRLGAIAGRQCLGVLQAS